MQQLQFQNCQNIFEFFYFHFFMSWLQHITTHCNANLNKIIEQRNLMIKSKVNGFPAWLYYIQNHHLIVNHFRGLVQHNPKLQQIWADCLVPCLLVIYIFMCSFIFLRSLLQWGVICGTSNARQFFVTLWCCKVASKLYEKINKYVQSFIFAPINSSWFSSFYLL